MSGHAEAAKPKDRTNQKRWISQSATCCRFSMLQWMTFVAGLILSLINRPSLINPPHWGCTNVLLLGFPGFGPELLAGTLLASNGKGGARRFAEVFKMQFPRKNFKIREGALARLFLFFEKETFLNNPYCIFKKRPSGNPMETPKGKILRKATLWWEGRSAQKLFTTESDQGDLGHKHMWFEVSLRSGFGRVNSTNC